MTKQEAIDLLYVDKVAMEMQVKNSKKGEDTSFMEELEEALDIGIEAIRTGKTIYYMKGGEDK